MNSHTYLTINIISHVNTYMYMYNVYMYPNIVKIVFANAWKNKRPRGHITRLINNSNNCDKMTIIVSISKYLDN